MIRKIGTTRIVFLIGRYAIKLSNHGYCHQHFLQGCYANWAERNYCKMFKDLPIGDMVAPSIFCSWFGLFQIQKRCEPLNRDLTAKEEKMFKDVCTDIKAENFGIYEGRLVCLDYV